MQEVLKKAADLVALLEEKISSTEALNKQLSEKKIAQLELDKKQQAASNQLSARERIVSRIEDIEKARNEMKESAKKVAADKVKNNIKASALNAKEEALDKEKEDLEVMKAVYAKKNANMDAREIEYNTKFKLMREKVLEEIKGKL